jgi:hypothetical protein
LQETFVFNNFPWKFKGLYVGFVIMLNNYRLLTKGSFHWDSQKCFIFHY